MMKQRFWMVGLVTVMSLGAAAQTAPPPSFEVVSIKPSDPSAGGNSSWRSDRGRVTLNNINLRNIVANACKVQDYALSGPDWMRAERFDIVATLPPGASEDQTPLMIQAMLAERFKMQAHRETRESSAYALVIGKSGSKLQETEPGDSTTSSSRGHVEAKKHTPSQLAAGLSSIVGRPVKDETGLKGQYNYTLDYAVDPALLSNPVAAEKARAEAAGESKAGVRLDVAAAASDKPTIFTAVVEQLGLRLESRKAQMEVIVVDHIEKTPTGN